MLLEHELIVHLVDVIARQDDDVLRAVALNDVDILEYRIGRSLVPHLLRDALARGKDVEALVPLLTEEVPSALHMADQAVGLVLSGDCNAAHAGIQSIRKGKIDDAALAAEEHGGLRPLVGQLQQRLPRPPART